MRALLLRAATLAALPSLLALEGGCGPSASSCDACALDMATPAATTQTNIQHLVILVQENHSFDNHFGRYCTAPSGSNPTCTDGPACCEASPDKDPAGTPVSILDDAANGAYSPDHTQACELSEIDGGKMDRFTTVAKCASPNNFAVADPRIIKPYWDYAAQGALADRYFQPVAGETSSNDMFFARAKFVFLDNEDVPAAIGGNCDTNPQQASFPDPTIGDLLDGQGVSWTFYAEGYRAMAEAMKAGAHKCPPPPPDCLAGIDTYPCVYDPSDDPFAFYPTVRDNPLHMRDLADLAADLQAGTLPAVSFVKAIGYKTEHPSLKNRLSDGVKSTVAILGSVLSSSAASSTLLVLTYDESGGYFDHVAPPPVSTVDGQPYGARVPTLALGPFARRDKISHVVMEHSSLVKFIEWNWLGGRSGQLGTRDAVVNNIGSLLDPAATGTPVPEGASD